MVWGDFIISPSELFSVEKMMFCSAVVILIFKESVGNLKKSAVKKS